MVLALAAVLLASPAAGAVTLRSSCHQEFATALGGIDATDIVMSQDSTGDPIVITTLDTTQFQVLIYGCADDDRCASIQLRSGYDVRRGDVAGRREHRKRYGKVWLDDEADPFIELDLDLDLGEGAATGRWRAMRRCGRRCWRSSSPRSATDGNCQRECSPAVRENLSRQQHGRSL